jgi:hypothetical protein
VDLSSAGSCDGQLTGGAERECVGSHAFRGVLNVGGGAPRCVGARSVAGLRASAANRIGRIRQEGKRFTSFYFVRECA